MEETEDKKTKKKKKNKEASHKCAIYTSEVHLPVLLNSVSCDVIIYFLSGENGPIDKSDLLINWNEVP